MNSLSWLLYAADVAGTIKTSGGLLAVFGLAGAVCAYPASFMAGETWSWNTEEENAVARARPAQIQKVAKSVAIASLVVLGIGALLPSRNTIMLIAASEVGETMLASEEVQRLGGEAGALAKDSLTVLRKFITEQLDEGQP